MSKIDTSIALYNMEGEPMAFPDKRPLTIGTVSIEVLCASYKDEEALQNQGPEKNKRFKLAQRIKRNVMVNLDSSEIVMIKDLVAKAYGTVVSGQMWELLEGKTVILPFEKKKKESVEEDDKETTKAG